MAAVWICDGRDLSTRLLSAGHIKCAAGFFECARVAFFIARSRPFSMRICKKFLSHTARAEERRFEILLVEYPHDLQLRRRCGGRLVVDGRARDAEQRAFAAC
jgi:hypothetical protein